MVTRKSVGPIVERPTPEAAPPYPTTPIVGQEETQSQVSWVHLHNEPALVGTNRPRTEPSLLLRRDSDISSHGTWDSDDDLRQELESDGDGHDEEIVQFAPQETAAARADPPAKKGLDVPPVLTPGNQSIPRLQVVPDTPSYVPVQPLSPIATSKNPYIRQDRRPSNTRGSDEQANPILQPQPLPFRSRDPVAPEQPSFHSSALPATNPWRAGSSTESASAVAPSLPPPAPSLPSMSSASPHVSSEMPEPSLIDFGDPPSREAPPQPTIATPRNDPQVNSIPTPPVQRPSSAANGGSETPRTQSRRQRNEFYQIKHVNWSSAYSASGPGAASQTRTSPILTQNANGPCPLLALVNALVLSTPPNVTTSLTETLRSREQVSLGLLLDAVFDELTSGRRGQESEHLPDVDELYAFLLALHTGMNVNPCLVVNDIGASYQPKDLKSSHRQLFEDTKELRLYGTFGVPLVHGWLEPNGTTTYRALMRNGRTFEDIQNALCAGAELEDQLRTSTLDEPLQNLVDDVTQISKFLSAWPTQLTEYGLDMVLKHLPPGQFAIFFRNDHFGTIYKEPSRDTLMTLVTDAGYASHDEIVWESLVDINGAANEYFSGDFRTVNYGSSGWASSARAVHANTQQPGSSVHQSQNLSLTNRIGFPVDNPIQPQSSSQVNGLLRTSAEMNRSSEQEDRDLALALQLQEEEEQREREAIARRQREQELSEQFLSSEGQPPQMPPRPSNPPSSGTATPALPVRPAVNRSGNTPDPDAPPTYEQSSSDRLYRPAGATAPATQGNPLNAYNALRMQQSNSAQQSTSSLPYVNGTPSNPRRRSDTNRIRRRSSQMGTVAHRDGYPSTSQPMGEAPMYPGRNNANEERCVIM